MSETEIGATETTETETTENAEADETVEIRKAQLVDLVVEKTGVKKRDAKPVVEATLALLGKALSEGQALNLQPLGKLQVNSSKTLDNGQVLKVRIRRSSQALAESEGLESSSEEG